MAVLKEEDFEVFLGQGIQKVAALLIHGDDEALVSSLARRAILKLSDGAGSSLLVDQMEASACKKSPGIFLDALNSISLLGDRRLILFDAVDDSCLKFLEETLSLAPGGTFVLLKSSALKRDSELRMAFETAVHTAAMALYPDDERVAFARARSLLETYAMKWDEDAEQSFFSLVGYDRPVVAQEIAKLALYCWGKPRISTSDVVAVCGDVIEESLEDTIDVILSGDLAGLDRALAGNFGRDGKALLPALASHLSRLVVLRSALDGGETIDQVIRNARPPVFFKRRAAIVNQLSRFGLAELVEFQAVVQSLILRSRQLGDISEAATNRGLLVLARNLRVTPN